MLSISSSKISYDDHLQKILAEAIDHPQELNLGQCYSGILKVDLGQVRSAWQSFLESGDTLFAEDFRFRNSGGTYIWISCRAEKVRLEDIFQRLFVCGSIQNIHERKSKVLELEHYQQRLTHQRDRPYRLMGDRPFYRKGRFEFYCFKNYWSA